MLTTFKKIASLYFQTGSAISAAKYFEKAQLLLEAAIMDSDLSDEMRKELLQSQESTYFQQYLVAAQSEDLPN